MKERLRILNKQGDFMYFYKKYPELVRNPPSNVIYIHNPTEEIDKFCDRDGWFEPETATRRGRERMKYLEKQGDFMFFYKNYPNLIRNTASKMIMPPSAFPEEWEKYCDNEGWFEPENATRRGRRKMKFAIERYKRKNSSFMKGTREGQETDWDIIDERNNERNEKGMLYTNQY